MSNIFNKLKDFVGLNETDETEDYDYIEEQENVEAKSNQNQESKPSSSEAESSSYRRRYSEFSNTGTETVIGSTSRSNVIGMPGINQAGSEVVVIEPHSFAEMPKVIQILKERRSVVLNLNVMDPEEAQRAVDFVAGGTYAIDGNQERIGESIFLFTPNCVKVSTITGIANEVTQMDETEGPKVSRMPTHANSQLGSSWGVRSS
ncbi:cell division protein SepF [Gloeocapsa sp. PCC 73106]|uniref:cell division protein SepF n=1 Tax=Gloeocapsa sp. PCC 73106 TaxID=102232 RepID=UPI0002ABC9C9|nr:cell division protein SepF [Gloeocapsa sp. PCC 73106]ELR99969.1 hypothetical protein GLO73106DRAFT_00038230 [Gloeocapsa sp. PCC 73106]